MAKYHPNYIVTCYLSFLSIDGLYKSMGYKNRNSLYPQFTDHCFTGEYPVKPVDASNKNFKDDKLSLIASKSLPITKIHPYTIYK